MPIDDLKPGEELTINDGENTPKDDQQTTVDQGDGQEPEPFVYDDEEPNLVKAFKSHPDGEEALREVSKLVRDNYRSGMDSTEEYRKRKERDWKIFIGNLPKKEGKFKDGANTHVPIMLENTTRNVFRAESELFGDWDNVFGVVPLGPHDEEMAQVLTLHGNWQLRVQIPDFKRQQSRGMMAFFTNGDVTCHSFYDPFRKQNRHEILTCDDFIVPYTHVSTMPDWSDVPWRIKVQMMQPHQLEERRLAWEGVDELLDKKKPSFDDEPEMAMHVAVAKDEGIEVDEVDASAPYKILWFEGWLELPNQDRRRWCRVMADEGSDQVFELAIHEEPDWQDVQRYETQMGELSDYRAQVQSQQAFLAQQQQMVEQIRQQVAFAMDSGMDAQGAEIELAQAEEMMGQMAPPPAPTWMRDPQDPEELPDPVEKVPIHLFSHGVCIETIVGNLGIGYGHMQADFNRAANTALQQFTDSATGNNLWSLIADESVEFDGKDQLNMEWGKIIRASGLGVGDIRQKLLPLKPDPANPQLIEVVKMSKEFAQSSMQSPSVLSGDPGKSGEPFRGIAARIEQATKQLSVSTRKYANFLEQILKNNAKLNAVYLRDEEFFHVALQSGSQLWAVSQTPAPGQPFDGAIGAEFKIGKKMYERNYHVEIRSDLRFVTQSQKIQEADELVAMATKIPFLQANPAFQYEAVKKALVARGRNDMVAVLGPPPPSPQPQLPGPRGIAPPGALPASPAGGAPGGVMPPQGRPVAA
jgi:hypothetical protein